MKCLDDVLQDVVLISEASEITGYSNQHIRLLADTGKISAKLIPTSKRCKRWIVYLPSLIEYQKKR